MSKQFWEIDSDPQLEKLEEQLATVIRERDKARWEIARLGMMVEEFYQQVGDSISVSWFSARIKQMILDPPRKERAEQIARLEK